MSKTKKTKLNMYLTYENIIDNIPKLPNCTEDTLAFMSKYYKKRVNLE